jgi:GNAT superfamily N-acetyltransferase
VIIREARPEDVDVIFGFIIELAEYEHSRDQVRGNPEMVGQALFGPAPAAEAVIAERDGETIGFALFHGTFSTWECVPGIWLEDLYVPPAHRRGGVGEALLRHVAGVAVARGCGRLEWNALDWNAPALSFYAKLGADVLGEWKLHRLSGDALGAMAGG